MKRPVRSMLSNMDIVTLKHIQDAEDHNSPVPPAFIDTLVRLSKADFIFGDSIRALKISETGREFLRTDSRR